MPKNVRITDQSGKGIKTKASDAVSVTPDDTTDLSAVTNGIYLGAEGNLEVTLENMNDGESVTFVGMKAGIIYPLRVKRVWATNTTATDILAVY